MILELFITSLIIILLYSAVRWVIAFICFVKYLKE